MRVLLVVYDNGSHVHTFPQGTAYIAAALRNAGHRVVIWQQDVNHWPDEKLTEFLDESVPFDVVGLGVIGGYWQYQRMLGLSKAINASVHRPKWYILGGHGPSPAVEFFLRRSGANFVVRGEGERTVVELLDTLEDESPLELVFGISFLAPSGDCVNTPNRPLLRMEEVPRPAYDLFPIEYYRLASSPNASRTDFVMPVASARGCPFRCNFCYRMDPGVRLREPVDILDEIGYLQRRYGITYIDFSDELLMTSEERTHLLCEAFLRHEQPFKWCCNGRLNYATKEVLQLMKRTGCVFINYGIESFDDEALRRMNKHLTCEQIVRGVENTIAVGLSAGLNVIWGNLGEDERTLRQSVGFLKKYADTSHLRTIRPVTPYPGSDLFRYATEHGLLQDAEEFYEQKHKNSDLLAVNFTSMSDDGFHRALMEANCELIEDHYSKVASETMTEARSLYQGHNINFRGFRQM